MLQDSVLGVELLLRQFQNIFAWRMKLKNLDNLSYVKLWNLDSLLCKKFAQIVCVNEMMKFGLLLFMCEQIWTVWTYQIDWTSFWTDFMCERVEQNFLWSFCEIWTDFVWSSWINFFIKFLWNLNRFCCYFLNRLNRFCCYFLNIFCYEVFVKLEQILLLFFLWDWTDFWTNFMCEY